MHLKCHYLSEQIRKYLAHLCDDGCLPNVADVHHGLETTTDGFVMIQDTDISLKL